MSAKLYEFTNPETKKVLRFGSRPRAVAVAKKLGVAESEILERPRAGSGAVTEVLRPGAEDTTSEIEG